MMLELARLILGVSIAVFHRPLAGKIMEQERALDTYFRAQGVYLPAPLSDSAAQDLYFFVGVFICLVTAARIWMELGS